MDHTTKMDEGKKRFRIPSPSEREEIDRAICTFEVRIRAIPKTEPRKLLINRTALRGLQIVADLEDGDILYQATLQIRLAKWCRVERFKLGREEMHQAMTLIGRVHRPLFDNKRKSSVAA